MSATPERSKDDGQTRCIELLFGPIRFKGDIERNQPKVKIIEYPNKLLVYEYAESVTAQIEDQGRNEMIAKEIVAQAKSGRKILVLTKRVAHYSYVEDAIRRCDPSVRTLCLESDAKKQFRRETMEALRGKIDITDVILATTGLAGTGTDFPAVDTVFFICDLKSEILTKQAVGRCLRIFEGKKDPLLIDVHDTGQVFFNRQGKIRQSVYEEMGWEVT
jgi:superfamily II DNA or RNA helicase